MDKRYIEPYKDMFNIYNLITEINKDYRLYFDKKNKCFFIINIANNFEICFKFNNFSLNILKELQRTQVSNSYKLFKSIDENNEKISENNEKNIKNNISSRIEDLKWFASRTNKILQSDIKKIIEV